MTTFGPTAAGGGSSASALVDDAGEVAAESTAAALSEASAGVGASGFEQAVANAARRTQVA